MNNYNESFCMGRSVLSRSVVSDSLRPHELQPTRLLCPWDFPGKRTGVGRHFLLQGIFPTQGWNLCLLHRAGGFFTTEPPGKPMRCTTSLKKKKNSICCVPELKFTWTSCSLSGNPAYCFPFWAYIRAKSVDTGAGHSLFGNSSVP